MLNEGFGYLQDSALLIIQNNIDAENPGDIEQECMLVPRKAFVNSYAQPFSNVLMSKPIYRGDDNQKVLIDSMVWKTIEQSGGLIYNSTTKLISGCFMAEC
jgi:hypothetical protein